VKAPKYSVLQTFPNLLTALCNCLLTSQAKAMPELTGNINVPCLKIHTEDTLFLFSTCMVKTITG